MIFVIDDQEIFHKRWTRALKEEVEVRCFYTAEAVFTACENEPDIVPRIQFILVDKLISLGWGGDNYESKFGLSFRQFFPQFRGKIILSTAFPLINIDLQNSGFDGAMDKGPLTYKQLCVQFAGKETP